MPPARHAATACALALALGPLATTPSAQGRPKVKFHQDWARHPSARYAALSAERCREALVRRKVAFEPVRRAPGVLAPVRLTQGVGGVLYRTAEPAHRRADNPNDVFDCRLALALSDFSRILRVHDIGEVLMFSAWRPPSPMWPEGKLATRHPGGLAIDIYRFVKKRAGDGFAEEWLDVERDFVGRRGAPVCGEGAGKPASRGAARKGASSPPADAAARELRSIVCEAADQHIFTSILTPNYDRAHRNHLHLEVTPDVQWQLVR
ncbi:extensin family protein [Sorangium sp. So ce1153]|uniref:extensin family protein n=1 Tax=Sorangium sp. So ce1153 TaxID=3133333 RepID=UPI003F62AD24